MKIKNNLHLQKNRQKLERHWTFQLIGYSPLRLFWGIVNSIVCNVSGTPAGKYLLLKKINK